MDKLSREALFAIVTDAAFHDGQLEAHEKKILEQLTGFLRLDGGLAMALARRSQQRFAAGELGPSSRLDGDAVYARCLEVALADGMLEESEEALLKAMRGLFKVSPGRHEELLGRARSQKEAVAPPLAPALEAGAPAGAAATRASLDAQAASILATLEADPEACRPSEEALKGRRKSSSVVRRFRLRAGGLPIPFVVNMLMAGLAGAMLLGGVFLTHQVFPREVRGNQQQSFGSSTRRSRHDRGRRRVGLEDMMMLFFAVVSGGAYWGLRQRYESSLLGSGAEIKVSEGTLVLPALVRLPAREPVSLGKSQVDRIDLGVNEEGEICSLAFAVKGESRLLRFGAGAVEDPAGLASALGELFGVPANKQSYSFWTNNLEIFLAGGLALLGCAVLYAMFFS
jgi:hypothetical protein